MLAIPNPMRPRQARIVGNQLFSWIHWVTHTILPGIRLWEQTHYPKEGSCIVVQTEPKNNKPMAFSDMGLGGMDAFIAPRSWSGSVYTPCRSGIQPPYLQKGIPGTCQRRALQDRWHANIQLPLQVLLILWSEVGDPEHRFSPQTTTPKGKNQICTLYMSMYACLYLYIYIYANDNIFVYIYIYKYVYMHKHI